MEHHGAIQLWGRSLQKKLCYTTMVRDGDADIIKALKALKPYGEIEVKKEECKNHLHKWVGTSVRALKESDTVKTNTKTGKKRFISLLGESKQLTTNRS